MKYLDRGLLRGLGPIVLFYTTLISLFVWGCTHYTQQSEKDREARKRWYRQKPIHWCVQACVDNNLDALHSKVDTWGASSSSATGFKQSEFYTKVLSYCSGVYKECYAVNYISPFSLEGSGIYYTANQRPEF